MQKLGLFLGAVGALALIGCGGSGGRRGGDDAGGIMLMDSGPGTDSGGGTDAGGGGTDAGGGGTDAGGGGTCAEAPVPPFEGAPPCAASTLTCLMSAMTEAEYQACFDADPNRDMCVGCVNQNIISCANDNGCQDEWNCLSQCADENCPDGSCLMTTCATQNSAFDSCLGMLPSGACGSALGACFMSGS